MKKFIIVLLMAVVMTGCASKPRISDISPFGPDTFKIKAFNNQGEEDKLAIDAAYTYCESLGKHFMPVQGEDMYLQYSLIFNCLGADDPALKRPVKGIELVK
ncbi:MAG: hypothetical protein AMJ61_13875 [Desulfobacterales bacterium SG8_35_2]|nr:MAG: hypothetical protein AMJ61_13875 [Desulfobacterales bacterium SG8_35_2]